MAFLYTFTGLLIAGALWMEIVLGIWRRYEHRLRYGRRLALARCRDWVAFFRCVVGSLLVAHVPILAVKAVRRSSIAVTAKIVLVSNEMLRTNGKDRATRAIRITR